MSAQIPPLRFRPIYQTRVWGGRRLEKLLGRELPDAQPYGESWELSDREDAQSVVADGPLTGSTLHELWTGSRAEIFGARYETNASPRFPILLKVLDCEDVLSLQVHPPASVAPTLGGEPKTEMWYVAHAEAGARIFAGLKHDATRTGFVEALQAGTVADLVHTVFPEKGQFMFVESGRLHALGAGLLVYEIQQNSDTTYRVFDWNRVGLDGKPRALHVEESLACIDFGDFEPALQNAQSDGLLARCSWFDTRLAAAASGEVSTLDRPEDFVCLALTRGTVVAAGTEAATGDFLLIPPSTGGMVREVEVGSDAEWLEIRLP